MAIVKRTNTLTFELTLVDSSTEDVQKRSFNIETAQTDATAAQTLATTFKNTYMTNFANKQQTDPDLSIGSLIQPNYWMDYNTIASSSPATPPAERNYVCTGIEAWLTTKTVTYFDRDEE